MIEKGDISIWGPDEIVYSAGDISKEVYLVMAVSYTHLTLPTTPYV